MLDRRGAAVMPHFRSQQTGADEHASIFPHDTYPF
jgi:hypothetical protein